MLASVTLVLGLVAVEDCPVVTSVDVDVAAALELVSGKVDDDVSKGCALLGTSVLGALLVDVADSDAEVDAADEVLAAALLEAVEASAGCVDADVVLAMLLALSVED